jgi:hypothetical protein
MCWAYERGNSSVYGTVFMAQYLWNSIYGTVFMEQMSQEMKIFRLFKLDILNI